MTLRVYLRPEKRFPLSKQEAVVAEHEGRIVRYTEAERKKDDGFPQREAWIGSMRGRKDEVFAVTDWHRLASNGDDLKAVTAKIDAKGQVIVELRTGRRSDNPGQRGEMIHEALKFYAQRALTTTEAKKMARRGAKASPVTKPLEGRMPHDEALAFIDNLKKYSSVEDAVKAINKVREYPVKWNADFAYREKRFGRLNFKSRPMGPTKKP